MSDFRIQEEGEACYSCKILQTEIVPHGHVHYCPKYNKHVSDEERLTFKKLCKGSK